MPPLRTISYRGSPSTFLLATLSTQLRHASLTSSISAGVRRAGKALDRAQQRRIKEGTLAPWELKDADKVCEARNFQRQRHEREARLRFLRAEPQVSDVREDIAWKERKKSLAALKAMGMLVDPPSAVPYTNSAAEFLYGTYSVLAALRGGRRDFYKLYIWCGQDGNLQDNDQETTEIVRLASKKKIPVVRVAGAWDRMLDRMTARRPHNCLVLEATALNTPTVHALNKVDSTKASITAVVAAAAASTAPGKSGQYVLPPASSPTNRFPFLLWLDKVTDTGNMGAILRSAYFLGVDAVILPRHGTAPINALTIKTSAGAAEYLPMVIIEDELSFMKKSQDNGWLFYAAGANDSTSTVKGRNSKIHRGSSHQFSSDHEPTTVLSQHPVVLMLGNEGEGLRLFLQKQADYSIAIEVGRKDSLVDSLNVSVAAALLTQRFLVTPTASATASIKKEASEALSEQPDLS